MNDEEFDFENRLMTPEYTAGDEESNYEFSLRPRTLNEYIGQDKVKENLRIYIDAAKRRGESLDHVLLYGPPGLGKTTLSGIIAAEMGVDIRITSGPAIEKQGDLAALLTNLNDGDVLFIDEIHRLSRQVEEILYPAMEDHAIDIIIGKGPSARSIRLDLPNFTLVAPPPGRVSSRHLSGTGSVFCSVWNSTHLISSRRSSGAAPAFSALRLTLRAPWTLRPVRGAHPESRIGF